MYYIASFLFCFISLAPIVYFVVSLVLYCSAVKCNRKVEGKYSEAQIKNRKLNLILSSVIMGILLAIVIGIFVLLNLAISYM